MHVPPDLVLLRPGMLPEVPLRPGTFLHGRVVDARTLLLDLVRHRVPLTLFRSFSPLCLPRVNVLDGSQSIRRAWTPVEFRVLVGHALAGTRGTFRHTGAPGWIRQIADIRYQS